MTLVPAPSSMLCFQCCCSFSPVWIVNVFLRCELLMLFSSVNSEKYDSGVPVPCPADKLQLSAHSSSTIRRNWRQRIFSDFYSIQDIRGCWTWRSLSEHQWEWSLILPRHEKFGSLRKILSNSNTNMKKIYFNLKNISFSWQDLLQL